MAVRRVHYVGHTTSHAQSQSQEVAEGSLQRIANPLMSLGAISQKFTAKSQENNEKQ